jgi:hypothetical protein
MFNKITAEKFPKLKKKMPRGRGSIQYTDRHDQNRTSLLNIVVKTIITENKEKILKALREKHQILYKGKPIKLRADF